MTLSWGCSWLILCLTALLPASARDKAMTPMINAKITVITKYKNIDVDVESGARTVKVAVACRFE